MQKNAESMQYTDEIELRKQAIMIGLSSHLTEKECINAIHVWEQQYSRAPKFALQQFIKEVVKPNSQLWDFRNDIFINVIKAMSLRAEEVEQQFQQFFHGRKLEASSAVKKQKNQKQQLVFENLYRTFMQLMEVTDYQVAVQLRKFLREKMLYGRSFAMEIQRLNSWLLGITDKLEIELSMDEMKQIIHSAYLGSCEFVGPVKADALMSEAVKIVEKQSGDDEISPRELL
jgi:hypothetical protein